MLRALDAQFQSRRIVPDAAQQAAAERLQRLYDELVAFKHKRRSKLRKRLSNLYDGNWLDIAWAADGEMLWLVAPRARAAQPALPTCASHAPTLVPPRQIKVMAGTYTPPPMAAARPGALDFQRVGSHGHRC